MSSRSRSSSRGGSGRERSASAGKSASPEKRSKSPESRSPSPRSPSKSPQRRRSPSPRSPPRRRSPSPRRSPRRSSRSPRRSKRDRSPKRRSRSRDEPRRSRRDSRSVSPKRSKRDEEKTKTAPPAEAEKEKKEPVDLRTRAGGAYIPPAKLKLMQEQMADKTGEQYQRMNWERLKKKMHGLVNKINTANLVPIVRELLQENVIRGKGLLARSIIQAQAFSPLFSNVYSALVAVINSKFPHVGELVLRRLIVQFKRSFRRNDKATTVSVSKFIAHLINQQVAHELLALEIMMLMLEMPTEDSVEVAIAFLKECGAKLQEVAPRALDSVFARLRDILNDNTGQRIQYMIEAVMIIRKDKFKSYPIVLDDLDLIDEDDQTTHTMSLEDAVDPENGLNVFKYDAEFEKNEAMYDEIRAEIIGDADDSDEEESDEGEEGGGGEEDEEGKEAAAPATTEIIDNTEQNLVAFRREVYLTIQSSLDYQEAAHKLLKMNIKPELEVELCHMLVDCCTQSRTYERFYGLLCERFCRLKKEFQDTFEQVARDTYSTVHRFEITKLRNIARLISHLLYTDAISWMVLSEIKLTEEDTTSSGRIYIKYIFQELVESMGLAKLYARIQDPTLQAAFDGIFPRDNPQNSRFAINFFTLIGLGGLTLDLREFLEKGMKKKKQDLEEEEDSSSDSSDSSDSDSDSSDSDSSSSSSSSSDFDSEDDKKKKKKKKSKEEMKKKEKKKAERHDKENKTAQKVKEEPLSPARSPARQPEKRREEERGRERREERRRDDGDSRSKRRDDRDGDRRDEGRRRERSHSKERRDRRRDDDRREDKERSRRDRSREKKRDASRERRDDRRRRRSVS